MLVDQILDQWRTLLLLPEPILEAASSDCAGVSSPPSDTSLQWSEPHKEWMKNTRVNDGLVAWAAVVRRIFVEFAAYGADASTRALALRSTVEKGHREGLQLLCGLVASVSGQLCARYLSARPSRVRMPQWRRDVSFLACVLSAVATTAERSHLEASASRRWITNPTSTTPGEGAETVPDMGDGSAATTATATASYPCALLRTQTVVLVTCMGLMTAAPAKDVVELLHGLNRGGYLPRSMGSLPATSPCSGPKAASSVERCTDMLHSSLPIGTLATDLSAASRFEERRNGSSSVDAPSSASFARFGIVATSSLTKIRGGNSKAGTVNLLPMNLLDAPPIPWAKWLFQSAATGQEDDHAKVAGPGSVLEMPRKGDAPLVSELPALSLLSASAMLSFVCRRHEIGSWEYPPLEDNESDVTAAQILRAAINELGLAEPTQL